MAVPPSTEHCLGTGPLVLSASEHSQASAKAEGRTLQAEGGPGACDASAELSCGVQPGLNEDSQAGPAQSHGSAPTAPAGTRDVACAALAEQPCQGSSLGKDASGLESGSVSEMSSEEQREAKLSGDEGSSFRLMLSQELSFGQEDTAAKQTVSATASARDSSQNLPQEAQNKEGSRKASLEEGEEAAPGEQDVFLRAGPRTRKGCDAQPQLDRDSQKGHEEVCVPPVLELPPEISAGGSSEESRAEGAGAEEDARRAKQGSAPEESQEDAQPTTVSESQLTPERDLPPAGKGEAVLAGTPPQRAQRLSPERPTENQQKEPGLPEEEQQRQGKSPDVPASLSAGKWPLCVSRAVAREGWAGAARLSCAYVMGGRGLSTCLLRTERASCFATVAEKPPSIPWEPQSLLGSGEREQACCSGSTRCTRHVAWPA